jgi:DNA gyrase/topoisomerase IV subunit B
MNIAITGRQVLDDRFYGIMMMKGNILNPRLTSPQILKFDSDLYNLIQMIGL